MAVVMLESAQRDAAAYHALVRNAEIHDSILGFHAQQVVEKALKAALFKHGVHVPRTHNIAQLLDVLDDAAVLAPPHADWIDELNPYAVAARYGLVEAGRLDRQRTLTAIADLLAWASLQVSGTGST